jgi:hypothetical protein
MRGLRKDLRTEVVPKYGKMRSDDDPRHFRRLMPHMALSVDSAFIACSEVALSPKTWVEG